MKIDTENAFRRRILPFLNRDEQRRRDMKEVNMLIALASRIAVVQNPVFVDPGHVGILHVDAVFSGERMLLPAPIIIHEAPLIAFDQGPRVAPTVMARIVVEEKDLFSARVHRVRLGPEFGGAGS